MSIKLCRGLFPILLALVVAGTASASSQKVITDPIWNGSDEICCMGYPNTSTYGEVVTAPSTMSLTGYSFYLDEPVGFEFQTFVAPWNGSELSGPMQYLSPVTETSTTGMVEYTFGGLNVPVTGGGTYVLGVTIDNVYAADGACNGGEGCYGGMGGNIEKNGNSTNYFVWSNESGDLSELWSNWETSNQGCVGTSGDCGQAAFVANFASAPEPSSIALLGLGLMGLLGFARRHLRS